MEEPWVGFTDFHIPIRESAGCIRDESLDTMLLRSRIDRRAVLTLVALSALVPCGRVSAQGYAPASLSQPVGDEGAAELGDTIGAPDDGMDRVVHHESLVRLLADLPDGERRVLAYRFFGDMTQTRLAELLGVSQMQVSRLQARALGRLRQGLFADG